MGMVYVSYDEPNTDMSAITCCTKGTDGKIEMKVGYVGEKADILYRLITEQGYLNELTIRI